VLKGLLPGVHLFDTVKGGSGKKGYNIEFNLFLHDERDITVTCKQLRLVPIGAEEKEFKYDLESSNDDDANGNLRKLSLEQESIWKFKDLSKDVPEKATVFNFAYGKEEEEEKIVWDILPDGKHVMDLPFEPLMEAKYLKDITWKTEEEKDYNRVFFDHFFPSINNHSKIIDEYLSDPHAKWHNTTHDCWIKFHDLDDDDPDWKVHICYTLIIAAASEVANGVENLWKKGQSGDQHNYPDFG
jgi:hypothetical protein